MLKETLKKITKSSSGQQFTKTVGLFECDECAKVYEGKHVPKLAKKLTFCSMTCMNQSASNGKLLEKKRAAAVAKYGTTHHEKSESYKEKKKESNLEKLGVEHHWMLDSVKEKRIATWQNKYGVSNPYASKDIKEKLKLIFMDKYGAENPFASDEIKLKIKQVCLERYGVDHVSKSQEIHKKQVASQVGMNYDFYYDFFLDKLNSYRRKVWAETRKQPLASLENFSNRGRKGYHLDHIYSVKQGFIDDVDPIIVGNICNLRMIKSEENIAKFDRCDISLEMLLEEYKKRNK